LAIRLRNSQNRIAQSREDAKEYRARLFFATWRLCAKIDVLNYSALHHALSAQRKIRRKQLIKNSQNWIAQSREDAKEYRAGLFFAPWRLCAKIDVLNYDRNVSRL
jgi:hypothetical protein